MRRLLVPAALLGAMSVVPASAACHIAAFDQAEGSGREGGRVTLTVRLLGGQPSCEGSVTFSTQDGSARAGADYVEASGRLEFQANDDRTEELTIGLLDDGDVEGDEELTVVLGPVAGSGIQPEGVPATITIRDDDEAASSSTPDDPPSPEDKPTEEPAPSPAPTATSREVAASNTGLYVGVGLALALLLIAFALRARRAT